MCKRARPLEGLGCAALEVRVSHFPSEVSYGLAKVIVELLFIFPSLPFISPSISFMLFYLVMGYDLHLCYFIFPDCYSNLYVMAFVGDFLLFYWDHKLFVRSNSIQTNAMFSYHDLLIPRERSGYVRVILYLLRH